MKYICSHCNNDLEFDEKVGQYGCVNCGYVEEYYTMLEEYIGNKTVVTTIKLWLQEWHAREPYVILHGAPGNGKTYLTECLAHDYDLDLLLFNYDDTQDYNTIKKSLNLQSIGSNKNKLIVFDNIQDFRNKNQLYNMHKISNYPIIFIVDNIHNLNKDFVSNGLVLKIKRPLNFEIRKLLEQKVNELNITCKNLYDISERCKSVRTALQSMMLDFVIEKDTTTQTELMKVRQMSKRSLKEDISWLTMLIAMRNIKQIDINSYKLLKEFSYWDYVVHYLRFKNKSLTLDKIFFNSLPNIELVEPKWRKKFKKNNDVNIIKEEKQIEPQKSISSFF